MPYLKVSINKKIENKDELLSFLTREMSKALSKPETYFMTSIEDEVGIYFQGSTKEAAFIELRSIGLQESKTKEISRIICNLINEKLDIPKDRIYINFFDIKNTMWGWNENTF